MLMREWSDEETNDALRRAVALLAFATRNDHAEMMTLTQQVIDTDDPEVIAQLVVAQAMLAANVIHKVLPNERRRETWLKNHLFAAAGLTSEDET